MYSNNRDQDLLITNFVTWTTIFGAFLAVCVAGTANAQEREQRSTGMQAKAVATAVISRGISFGAQQLSYAQPGAAWVEPQQTTTQCDKSYEITNCKLIIKEMQ